MRSVDSGGCEQKYREQIVATSKPKLSVKNFPSKIIYKKYETCPTKVPECFSALRYPFRGAVANSDRGRDAAVLTQATRRIAPSKAGRGAGMLNE
jgi:hypothetical protein